MRFKFFKIKLNKLSNALISLKMILIKKRIKNRPKNKLIDLLATTKKRINQLVFRFMMISGLMSTD